MLVISLICLLLQFELSLVDAATCSVSASSFESEFCTMKQEIEAVKQFSSRISTAEHELLTLKHTVQTETAEIKDTQKVIQSLQKNITDTLSGVTSGNMTNSDIDQKLDTLLKAFKDIQNRLDHLEIKCQTCGNGNGSKDPCAASPCQNGGRCVVLSNDFQCICSQGYTGARCQYTDYCAAKPCQNGATCSSNILGHVCTCTSGYMGPYCEIKMNACDSNPCMHGTCILQGSSYTCQCDSGFKGTNCDQSNGATNLPTTTSMAPSTGAHPDPCADPLVCNEPAKCQAVGADDYKCVCPELSWTRSDNCLTPYYYEQFGFCCAKNTCKNDEVLCSPPTTLPPTTHKDPCADPSVCNDPATCKANGDDYVCVCPETPKTQADKCLVPFYYEQFGFCCAHNTCKNNELVCS